MTKHEIMKAYVEEKVTELVGSLTSFNFANDSPDSVSFLTNYSGKRRFPDFGANCRVKKIENLQNMPNLATVDWENMTAQYMIQCRVLYFEKERRS